MERTITRYDVIRQYEGLLGITAQIPGVKRAEALNMVQSFYTRLKKDLKNESEAYGYCNCVGIDVPKRRKNITATIKAIDYAEQRYIHFFHSNKEIF